MWYNVITLVRRRIIYLIMHINIMIMQSVHSVKPQFFWASIFLVVKGIKPSDLAPLKNMHYQIESSSLAHFRAARPGPFERLPCDRAYFPRYDSCRLTHRLCLRFGMDPCTHIAPLPAYVPPRSPTSDGPDRSLRLYSHNKGSNSQNPA